MAKHSVPCTAQQCVTGKGKEGLKSAELCFLAPWCWAPSAQSKRSLISARLCVCGGGGATSKQRGTSLRVLPDGGSCQSTQRCCAAQ